MTTPEREKAKRERQAQQRQERRLAAARVKAQNKLNKRAAAWSAEIMQTREAVRDSRRLERLYRQQEQD